MHGIGSPHLHRLFDLHPRLSVDTSSVQYPPWLTSIMLTSTLCFACSWQEHRRAVKARRTQPKKGSHLHLRLPWHRRHHDRRDSQQRWVLAAACTRLD